MNNFLIGLDMSGLYATFTRSATQGTLKVKSIHI